MQSSGSNQEQWTAPSLGRRLAAILYDSILVMAVLLMAIALITIPLNLIYGEDNFNPGVLRSNPFYIGYLFCVAAGFHVLFWMRGGQTLGMRSWRLKVLRDNGQKLRFKDALLRYVAAILSWAALGLGFIWVLIDKEGLAWHDRISKTRLVILKKK